MGLKKLKKKKYFKLFGGWLEDRHHCTYYKNWHKWLRSKNVRGSLKLQEE